jgi:hypothetical protein
MNNKAVLKIVTMVLCCAVLALFSGCGANSVQPIPPNIVVTISPTSASVVANQSQQFTATVQNDTLGRGVTWKIFNSGNTICDALLCGSIDQTGKYTAPSSVPTNPDLAKIPIGAVSLSDPSKMSAFALITILPPPGVAVNISPTTTTVLVGRTTQFTATVQNDPANKGVTWLISNSGNTVCTPTLCGTIDSNGNYTAPPVVPTPATLTVTATSVAVPTVFGTSAVTIAGGTGNNKKLNGQYAFLYKGYNSNGFLSVAGTFTADASGGFANLADSEVILISQGFNLVDHLHLSSSYSVNTDNRGTITLNTAQNFPTDGETIILSIALDSINDAGIATKGRLTSADQSVFGAGYGSGFLVKQDSQAVSAASIDGSYAFGLSGKGTTGLLAVVGRFTASGGSFNAGQADLNNSGTAAMNQGFTGTYDAITDTGFGTASFTIPGLPPNLGFAFLVVSADELIFIETDGGGNSASLATSGVALRQSGGPYSANSLDDPAVFGLTGVSDLSIGLETFNGNGAFTGTSDENNGGVITANLAIAGNYAVDVNGLGRGTITLQGGQPKPFYLVAPGEGFVIDMGQSPKAGMFEPQTGGTFDDSSISGSYAFGSLPSPENFTFALNSGVWKADGAGSVEGQEDNGAVFGGQFSGAYTVASNGRATMAVTPVVGASSNWIMYVISPSRIIAIRIDPGVMPNTIEIIEK